MLLTDLADVLRDGGLRVVEVDGWKTRSHGSMGTPACIVLHHTAGPKTGDCPSLPTVRDGRPDLAGPLAHLLLARSGVWYVVAAGLCWHTGATLQPWQSNATAIGIEAEATGVDAWPAVQMSSYVRGVRALADHYGIPAARVLGHKEIASPKGRKVDPNFDCAAFRAELENDMADVWDEQVTNAFGDKVGAIQVINGIEKRVADLQDTFGKLVVGGGTVDVDVLAEKVADLLAKRLSA